MLMFFSVGPHDVVDFDWILWSHVRDSIHSFIILFFVLSFSLSLWAGPHPRHAILSLSTLTPFFNSVILCFVYSFSL